MQWWADVQYLGQLTAEQLEDVAADAIVTRYQEGTELLTVRSRLDAIGYPQAVDQAVAWAGGPAAQTLAAAGVLTGPVRLVVESDQARTAGLDLLGGAEVAARLGVSTARARELSGRPDFPAPVAELAAGKVWRAEDVDAYATARDRSPGRPRKAR
jgi:hypothetical protein